MKTINTHKIANLLVRIRELNPSDSVYTIMRNAIDLKYGQKNFSDNMNTDHALVDALKLYLKRCRA